jgi:hypothetical protein
VIGVASPCQTSYCANKFKRHIISRPTSGIDRLLATTLVVRNNLKDHTAGLLAPLLCADNLDGLVLGLIAGHLDLGTSLLAEVVNGATTGSDNEPVVVSNVCLHEQGMTYL